MGQQQLLLIVLGIVVVGLAVIGGVKAFQQNKAESHTEGLVNEGLRVAHQIDLYRMRPVSMGGGGGAYPKDLKDVFPNSEQIVQMETLDRNAMKTPYGLIQARFDKRKRLNLSLTGRERRSDIRIELRPDEAPRVVSKPGWRHPNR